MTHRSAPWFRSACSRERSTLSNSRQRRGGPPRTERQHRTTHPVPSGPLRTGITGTALDGRHRRVSKVQASRRRRRLSPTRGHKDVWGASPPKCRSRTGAPIAASIRKRASEIARHDGSGTRHRTGSVLDRRASTPGAICVSVIRPPRRGLPQARHRRDGPCVGRCPTTPAGRACVAAAWLQPSGS